MKMSVNPNKEVEIDYFKNLTSILEMLIYSVPSSTRFPNFGSGCFDVSPFIVIILVDVSGEKC